MCYRAWLWRQHSAMDSTMMVTSSKHSVTAQLLAEEPRAHLTHCYGHVLILTVANVMKQSKVCSDALSTALEISKFNSYAAFDKIKLENPAEDKSVPSNGIRSFCPTRWNVSGNAVESIIDDYDTLLWLWNECLETKLEPGVKDRIISVQTQVLHSLCLFKLWGNNTVQEKGNMGKRATNRAPNPWPAL